MEETDCEFWRPLLHNSVYSPACEHVDAWSRRESRVEGCQCSPEQFELAQNRDCFAKDMLNLKLTRLISFNGDGRPQREGLSLRDLSYIPIGGPLDRIYPDADKVSRRLESGFDFQENAQGELTPVENGWKACWHHEWSDEADFYNTFAEPPDDDDSDSSGDENTDNNGGEDEGIYL